MAYTTGRCTNDLYCAAASAQQILQIPVGAQFLCPQCGRELVTPRVEKRGVSGPVLFACLGLVVAGGALFAAGAMIGATGRAPNAPTDPKAAAGEPAHPAEPATTLATLPPTPIGHAEVTSAPPDTAPPLPLHLAMIQVPVRPSTAPVSADARAKAAQATERARAQLQAQTQAQAAAVRQARLAEQARRAQAAQQMLAQLQQAAAAQSVELRRRAEQQAAMATLERQQEEAASEARAQTRAAALARQQRDEEVRRLAAVPPRPPGPTRGFSPSAVAGGAPSYPQAYENEGRSGRVTVSCLIGQNGAPSGCHIVAAQGGAGFSNAALSWLRNGSVRFAPVLHSGVATAEEHSWTISFEP